MGEEKEEVELNTLCASALADLENHRNLTLSLCIGGGCSAPFQIVTVPKVAGAAAGIVSHVLRTVER